VAPGVGTTLSAVSHTGKVLVGVALVHVVRVTVLGL
jgi:hypothetical protein